MAWQLSRNQLLSLQQPVTEFLREELGLVVQQGKTMVCDVNRGVSFLGIMSHYRSCRLRCQLFRPLRYLYNFGRFADDMRKYRLYPSLENSVMSKKFYQLNK